MAPITSPSPQGIQISSSSRASLSHMPDELTLVILGFLDVPDLLAVSRTTHHLRRLSQDHLLHADRMIHSRWRLSQSYPLRPSLASIQPPSSNIYVTSMQTLARSLGRQLISIRLKRSLSRRPDASSLVAQNVLPEDCYGARAGVAPGLVGLKRSVERARVKDTLRKWLEGKTRLVLGRLQSEAENDRTVRGLVRRFTARRKANLATTTMNESRKPPSVGGRAFATGDAWVWRETSFAVGKEAPTRAHVLGLRRFWEDMAKE